MAIVKHWDDYFLEARHSEANLIAYGAGYIGSFFYTNFFISPVYFCDRDADSIEAITRSGGGRVDVLTPACLIDKDIPMDVFVCMSFHGEPKGYRIRTLETVYEAFASSKREIVFYVQNPRDRGLLHIMGIVAIYDLSIYAVDNWNTFKHAYTCVEDFSVEYFQQIGRLPTRMRVISDKLVAMTDHKSLLANIEGGVRRTVGQPPSYTNTVHVIGDSKTVGFHNEDSHTFCSELQAMLNECHASCRVINHGIIQRDWARMVFQVEHITIGHGDIVLLVSRYDEPPLEVVPAILVSYLGRCHAYCKSKGAIFLFVHTPVLYEKRCKTPYEQQYWEDTGCQNVVGIDYASVWLDCQRQGIFYYDMTRDFSENKDETLFIDSSHWGSVGHAFVGKLLFKALHCIMYGMDEIISEEAKREIDRADACYDALMQSELRKSGYYQYIKTLGRYYKGAQTNAGAIVMNCNPFTNGHRYLIEWASQQVEILYIIVVQEDRSYFTFDTRIDLIRKGTRDICNVNVIPGGEYVISSITFPEYFSKETQLNQIIDASEDLLLFGTVVAPVLGIRKRFVGEEPYDPVTYQYNEQMKRILPDYGIEVIEIPRLNMDGEAVSASKVRRLLHEGRVEELRRYVPRTTYDYLICTAENGVQRSEE